MKKIFKPILFATTVFLMISVKVQAEQIGLVLYDSMPSANPMDVLGHAAAYLPHVCMDNSSVKFRVCEKGEEGVVINRYSDISTNNKLDWLALPASVNFYGFKGAVQSPIVQSESLRAQIACDYFNHSDLKSIFNPENSPFTQDMRQRNTQNVQDCDDVIGGHWFQAVSKTALQSSTIITVDLGEIIAGEIAKRENLNLDDPKVLSESAELENEAWLKVIAYLNQHAQDPQQFEIFFKNCANLTNKILDVAIGNFTGRGAFEDFFMVTPLSVSGEVRHIANKYQVPYNVTRINQVSSDYKHSLLPSNVIQMQTSSKSPLFYLLRLTSKTYLAYLGYLNDVRNLIPGFQIPFFLKPKFSILAEVKNHATEALAKTSAALKFNRLDKEGRVENKAALKANQDILLGTKNCWKDAEKSLNAAADWALEQNLITKEERSKMHKSNIALKLETNFMPLNLLTPGKQNRELVGEFTKNVKFDFVNGVTGTREIVMTLPDGIKQVGLSLDNVGQYDLGLGLKVLLISMYFDLDQKQVNRPATLEFDMKLKALEDIMGKLGADSTKFTFTSGVALCSASAGENDSSSLTEGGVIIGSEFVDPNSVN